MLLSIDQFSSYYNYITITIGSEATESFTFDSKAFGLSSPGRHSNECSRYDGIQWNYYRRLLVRHKSVGLFSVHKSLICCRC